VANEIEMSASLAYEDSGGSLVSLDKLEAQVSVTTTKFIRNKQSIGTTEEALALGEVTSLGWAMFVNRDSTNYLEIRSGTGAGNDIIKIPPGKSAGPFHFGSDVTAPYAIANTAACLLDYLIVSQ
jgi:hypothetical protein